MNRTCNVPSNRTTDRQSPVFGDLFDSFLSAPLGRRAPNTLSAALDVVEDADGYRLKLDLPGLTQDRISIKFADNVLTVEGERQDEQVGEADRWHVVERSHGSFARSVKFPTHVDPARVKASMKNGVLTVVVPKSETAKSQTIRIVEE